MQIVQTEYSFQEVFYHLKEAVQDAKDLGHKEVCIMDTNTYGFVKFEKICKELDVRPIYGLRVMMTDEIIKSRSKYETFNKCEELFLIATSQKGIQDLYKIYTISTERKYYFNRILPGDILGKHIITFSDTFRKDHLFTRKSIVDLRTAKMSKKEDLATYQCITGDRGFITSPITPMPDKASTSLTKRRDNIPEYINTFELPRSGMIKYNGSRSFELKCWEGFEYKCPDTDEYNDRLEYEIKMITDKGFEDYFLIVHEMIEKAKETMIVGPGRGSSGGSLVCYCLGITNINPIRFGLIFERFIDVNRDDLPDIDTDYPDKKRQEVIANTQMQYETAFPLAVVSKYMPKTTLNEFAKAYDIPAYDLSELKGSIIVRNSGDARANACLEDTLLGSETGRAFLEKYPHMQAAMRAEGHAKHSGKHAAGIVVLDDDINKYAAYDHNSGTICIEGPDAEYIGLLKIDCLGLRTLSVIENCLELSGVDVNDIYDIDLNNYSVLAVFNSDDLSDIFQFDGEALRMVNGSIHVEKFSDLSDITALGRPGALNSGGTNRYIKVKSGEQPPTYYGEIYEKVTKDTCGIVVFQEQTMVLLREYGGLTWGDVNIMRRAISKSKGDEFFEKYKKKFIDGAIANGHSDADAMIVWDAIASMGSYAFNKSHAVAYAMISYWCAYCKVNYHFNFLAANLNNAKDDDHGLKMLRQYVEKHDIEYLPVDPDNSAVGWTIQDGVLVGGLTNIDGIGEKKANDIIKRRASGKPYTKAILAKLLDPVTPYDLLYPISHHYKDYYEDNDITRIKNLYENEGLILTLGKVMSRDLRDRNDVQSLIKRKGKRVTENTHYLNIVIEDDTGKVKCTIAPFDMDRLDGLSLAENLKVGEVVAVSGKIQSGWKNLSVKEIIKL